MLSWPGEVFFVFLREEMISLRVMGVSICFVILFVFVKCGYAVCFVLVGWLDH